MNKKNKSVVISSIFASIFEWYDYTIFVHLSSVIGFKFFPNLDKDLSILNIFFIFATGYITRPLGGFAFGVIGDKLGRKAVLSLSLICMSLPTFIMGLIPTYESIGIYSTILIIISRIMQGFAIGGAIGSVSFIVEHADQKRRGIMGSVPMFGICIGVLTGSLVCKFTKYIFGQENFLNYAWRIPFLISVIVIYASFYIKRKGHETPIFKDLQNKNEISRSPISKVFAENKGNILISILINSTGSVIFYLQAVYMGSYLINYKNLNEDYVSDILSISYVVMAVFTVISGYLSDIIGRRKYFIFLVIFILISNFAALKIVQDNTNNTIFLLGFFFTSILAALYIGAEPALQVELYESDIRNTALSISYNTATTIFGGSTPYFLGLLFYKFGNITSFSYYISFCSLLSLVGLMFYKNKI